MEQTSGFQALVRVSFEDFAINADVTALPWAFRLSDSARKYTFWIGPLSYSKAGILWSLCLETLFSIDTEEYIDLFNWVIIKFYCHS